MSDAPMLTVRIHIVSPSSGRLPPVELALSPTTTLRDLLSRLTRDNAIPAGRGWTFRSRDGTVLQPTDMLGELAERQGTGAGVLELTLIPTDVPELTRGPVFHAPAPPAPSRRDTTADDEDEDDEYGSTSAEVSAPEARAEVGPARARKADGESHKFRLTERRATVRYYSRMNPDRMFPLLVILSAQQIEEIVKAKVKQAVSESFEVEEGSTVEVEPVLPGCDCYPPRHALAVESKDAVTETFWIVPWVLGRVHGARVLIRQGNRVLAEVPLDVRVAKQTLAVACGLLSLAAPYLTMGLKSLKLDYESQKADGFPLYQQAGNWVAEHVRPEWMGLGFLLLGLVLYLWMRPRRRDVFWDVNLK